MAHLATRRLFCNTVPLSEQLIQLTSHSQKLSFSYIRSVPFHNEKTEAFEFEVQLSYPPQRRPKLIQAGWQEFQLPFLIPSVPSVSVPRGNGEFWLRLFHSEMCADSFFKMARNRSNFPIANIAIWIIRRRRLPSKVSKIGTGSCSSFSEQTFKKALAISVLTTIRDVQPRTLESHPNFDFRIRTQAV